MLFRLRLRSMGDHDTRRSTVLFEDGSRLDLPGVNRPETHYPKKNRGFTVKAGNQLDALLQPVLALSCKKSQITDPTDSNT